MSLQKLLSVLAFTAMVHVDAFAVVSPNVSPRSPSSSLFVRFPDVSGVGYVVTVKKPLGVIFSENPNPVLGLVVDDIVEAQNGAIAGIRTGDNLVAVDGESVVGGEFDDIMGMLIAAPETLDVQLFRGNGATLNTVLNNIKGYNPEEEEEEEIIIMDENYVSPFVIEVNEDDDKPLTAGDVMKAFKKIGSNLKEDFASTPAPPKEKEESSEKKGFFGGMFGGGETIQLEGTDADGLKGVNLKKERENRN